MGSLLFCLAIHRIMSVLTSELCVFYFDDGTLGGSLEDVFCDLCTVEVEAEVVGLHLNRAKRDLICLIQRR